MEKQLLLSEIRELLDQQAEALKEALGPVDSFEYARRALRIRELLALLSDPSPRVEETDRALV